MHTGSELERGLCTTASASHSDYSGVISSDDSAVAGDGSVRNPLGDDDMLSVWGAQGWVQRRRGVHHEPHGTDLRCKSGGWGINGG